MDCCISRENPLPGVDTVCIWCIIWIEATTTLGSERHADRCDEARFLSRELERLAK